jgi:3D-(3,5/4)-trihydroxycyclohexane-1,2-dione acylhydrolase (decyclizing)
MSAMLNAFRTLTDPANTGAVCIAIPQDVEGEAYDYPESFFAKRVWTLDRRAPQMEVLEQAAAAIKKAKKPIMICGGGVRYSEAHEEFRKFAEKFGIPFGETQAGKSAVVWTHPLNLGGIGVTGCSAANDIAKKADLIIGVGTRYTDFTTASRWLFKENAKFVNINISQFQALKLDAVPVFADAKVALPELAKLLRATRQDTRMRSRRLARNGLKSSTDSTTSSTKTQRHGRPSCRMPIWIPHINSPRISMQV